MQQLVKHVLSDLGAINILVNNAGINRDKSFLKMTKGMWDEVMRVNLDGVFHTTQLVAHDMVGAGWGRIINISSIVGQTGNFGQANYAATKGAMISFTESLARELARKGITVNAVAPGFIETDMVSGMPEAALDQVRANTPMGRLGKPEEIADAVVFLASPRSSYVTGQVLAVNGGPFLGDHAGRQPQPETEEVRRNRVQLECAMRLSPVQEDRHPRDGDVRQRKHRKHQPPPREVQQAGKHHEIGSPLMDRS